MSLDISAAFDTMIYAKLIDRLNTNFGVGGEILMWLASFLSGRTQIVCSNGSVSSPFPCNAGVPQGSILGSLHFSAYVASLAKIISSLDASHYSFADDLFAYSLTKFGFSEVDL